jgi:hypothetical protein
VPKISKNGEISGCYLMINYMPAGKGVLKITSDE